MSSPSPSADPTSSSAASAVDLTQSGVTIPSDSENYGQSPADEDISRSSDSAAPLILYSPPTLWGLVRGAAINLFLPFINGLMLGFGELFAHEIAFRLGWSATKVFPLHRRRAGPGIEVRDDPVERRRRSGEEMTIYTSME